jgi:hypothetical protein
MGQHELIFEMVRRTMELKLLFLTPTLSPPTEWVSASIPSIIHNFVGFMPLISG